ncbi:LuxR C-terminal-related transcriptional regulator [Pelagibacterium sp. H642]|uniref:helix-turn-helix transcriptional regulator n=1 Tax=Pelagibacterium sp. H642 TaxID=1881069 RepID=UPI002814F1C8|nr:LuxR C-terminal-related transcriptional regulator [Pelagibacterium sp. H642]WMT89587.1 LuxR C-terminal-related transcriptional regulator [Pelagibacterium sp. H642]
MYSLRWRGNETYFYVMEPNRLVFALEELPIPLVYATHRIIRQTNAAFAGLFGYGPEELAGRSFTILYPELADFVMVGDLWRANFAGGHIYTDERIMRRRDGTRFWCRVRGRSMSGADPFSRAIYCFDPLPRPVETGEDVLTPRQRQIVTLASQGKTNAQIGGELGLSPRSVETHRYRMMRRLGLRNSAELIAWFAGLSGSGLPGNH